MRQHNPFSFCVFAILQLALFLFGLAGTAKAQQDPLYTHYMYNTLSVNPAYAGSRDALSVLALGRLQWVGFDGAPMTHTAQIHSPVAKGLSLGLDVVHDRLGPTVHTAAALNVTYRLELGKSHRLAFGLKGGMDFLNNNLTNLNIDQPGDPVFGTDLSNTMPNAGFGVYYDHTNAYVGISMPRILENSFNGSSTQQARHFYLIAGGYIPVRPGFDLKPATQIKLAMGAPLQVEGSLEMVFAERVSVGGFYRHESAVGPLLGVYVTPSLRIGYSFDWPLNSVAQIRQFGSHELMVRYDFNFKNKNKVVSPRYF
ncbi:MAG: type IX secretion system membrane protein PorP/SprF [Bacteroidetes bacterium]|nr:type IX secretion system membrane protein PorP/SprF [Bacteroidota bacterium]